MSHYKAIPTSDQYINNFFHDFLPDQVVTLWLRHTRTNLEKITQNFVTN